MTRVSVDKSLLRNVLRHTGAHNKIQEEGWMWRQLITERHSEQARTQNHSCTRLRKMCCSRMRCDGYDSEDGCSGLASCEMEGIRAGVSREVAVRTTRGKQETTDPWERRIAASTGPERWGHSGFKEQHPKLYKVQVEEAGSTTERRMRCKELKRTKKKRKKCKRQRKSSHSSSSDCSLEHPKDGEKKGVKSGKKTAKRKSKRDRGKKKRHKKDQGIKR
uniref:uncharacterized protein NKAPD1-like n=1 Tax=Myxine glutinosa TaxID=7769 RepID=UPI00358F2F9A